MRTTQLYLVWVIGHIVRSMPMPRKPRTKCLVCCEEPARSGYRYCSNICQMEYQHRSYIEKWKTGAVSGLRSTGVVSNPVKRYLRRKFEDKCFLCEWSKRNEKTGIVPLVADHIDGNWRNNTEENLRLICPNCDSLTPTYAALNRGKGREGRSPSKRAQSARLLA